MSWPTNNKSLDSEPEKKLRLNRYVLVDIIHEVFRFTVMTEKLIALQQELVCS
jgi:hypothetical protein